MNEQSELFLLREFWNAWLQLHKDREVNKSRPVLESDAQKLADANEMLRLYYEPNKVTQ